jgi:hypothetical protein
MVTALRLGSLASALIVLTALFFFAFNWDLITVSQVVPKPHYTLLTLRSSSSAESTFTIARPKSCSRDASPVCRLSSTLPGYSGELGVCVLTADSLSPQRLVATFESSVFVAGDIYATITCRDVKNPSYSFMLALIPYGHLHIEGIEISEACSEVQCSTHLVISSDLWTSGGKGVPEASSWGVECGPPQEWVMESLVVLQGVAQGAEEKPASALVTFSNKIPQHKL